MAVGANWRQFDASPETNGIVQISVSYVLWCALLVQRVIDPRVSSIMLSAVPRGTSQIGF